MMRASNVAWLFLTWLTLVQCGARTELETVDRCGQTGTVRSCSNSCGTGSQSCVDGYWRACEVLPIATACSGVCGAGVQTCENDHLSACLINTNTIAAARRRSSAREIGRGVREARLSIAAASLTRGLTCSPTTPTIEVMSADLERDAKTAIELW